MKTTVIDFLKQLQQEIRDESERRMNVLQEAIEFAQGSRNQSEKSEPEERHPARPTKPPKATPEKSVREIIESTLPELSSVGEAVNTNPQN